MKTRLENSVGSWVPPVLDIGRRISLTQHITVEDGQKPIKKILGEHKVITPKMSRCNFMFFYVFKMAVAIVFLSENAVQAVQISSISMILSLNCFYSILQRNTVATAIFNA